MTTDPTPSRRTDPVNDNTYTLTAEDIEDGHTLACYGHGDAPVCDECWSCGDVEQED